MTMVYIMLIIRIVGILVPTVLMIFLVCVNKKSNPTVLPTWFIALMWFIFIVLWIITGVVELDKLSTAWEGGI